MITSLLFLAKGILIGLIFGIPVGAVGTMTISRTLDRGVKAGLITGLGSSVADCIYASVGAFGLTFISDFLLQYQTVINLCGGTLVIFMGITTILKKAPQKSEKVSIAATRMFLSSFAVGITNPAAILTFLFAFSYFDLSAGMNLPNGIFLVMGVLLGTFLWWIALSLLASKFRQKALQNRRLVNSILGGLLALFGIIIILKTVL